MLTSQTNTPRLPLPSDYPEVTQRSRASPAVSSGAHAQGEEGTCVGLQILAVILSSPEGYPEDTVCLVLD